MFTVEIKTSKGWEIHMDFEDYDDALDEFEDLLDGYSNEAVRLTANPSN